MAEGSSSALAGWESRTCVHCGKKIVHTRQAAGYHWGKGKPWSEHMKCKSDERQRERAGADPASPQQHVAGAGDASDADRAASAVVCETPEEAGDPKRDRHL